MHPLPREPFWSTGRVVVVSCLLLLAVLPFALTGQDSLQAAWRDHWQPLSDAVGGAFRINHGRMLATTLVLVVMRYLLEPEFQGWAISDRVLRGVGRLFPVGLALLLGAFWLVIRGETAGLSPAGLYWAVIATEAATAFAGLCLWFSGRTRGGSEAGALLFLAAVPAWLTQLLHALLSQELDVYYRMTVSSVVGLLQVLSPEKVQFFPDTAKVTLGASGVRILEPCSGTEGALIGLLTLSAYLWLFRHRLRWPQAFLIVPVGQALLWAANVARIVTLVFYGRYWGMHLAVKAFHSNAGWIFFNLTVAGFVFCVHRLRWLRRENALEPPAGEAWWRAPASRYLLPLVALTFAGLVSGAFHTEVIDPFYAAKVLVGALCVAWLWRPRWNGTQGLGAAVAVGVLMFGVWLICEEIRLQWGADGTTTAAAPGPTVLGAWVLGSSLVIPVVEELAFRGFVLRRLSFGFDFSQRSYRDVGWTGIVVSSLIFAAFHTQVVGAFLAGVAYAMLARRTDGLKAAIVAHAVTNLLWAVFVVTTGSWRFL